MAEKTYIRTHKAESITPQQRDQPTYAPLIEIASPFTVTNNALAIAANSITAAMLAPNAVEISEIKDASVTAAKIASDAVITAKILDANVTTSKLAPNAVTAAKTSGIPVLNVIGQPALSDDDRFVTAVDMQATAYTIANAASADGLARNILITHTAGGTADTLGDAVIVGTDVNDEALTETITIVAGTTTAGTKCFKTVTSITTADWVIDDVDGTADTIKFGTGNLVGLPEVIAAQANVDLTTLGTAIIEATVTADGTDVSKCTVDASTGVYDGTKKLRVWIHK
jgi:hypothetical protein